jgi:hypothetical protein
VAGGKNGASAAVSSATMAFAGAPFKLRTPRVGEAIFTRSNENKISHR